MKNQVYTGSKLGRRFALCPTTVKAGDAVLVGTEPAVALDNYSSTTGGTVFDFNGSYNLTVTGQTQASPQVAAALKPGAKVYAAGTLDATTNVTTGLTLDGALGGTLFGRIDPSYTGGVASGLTDTNAILRLEAAS